MKGKIIGTVSQMLAAVCFCQAFVSTAFAAEPIAYWKMDSLDSSGKIPDVSGNDRPLTLFGNVCLTNDAVSGTALCNPGNTFGSYARFNCPADLKERTISMWLKLEADDGLYEYPEGTKNSYPYLFYNFSRMRFLWGHNSDNPWMTIYLGDAVDDRIDWFKHRCRWQHLVVTLSETEGESGCYTVSVYQDGVQTAQILFRPTEAWYTASSHSAYLMSDTKERNIRGSIDEVKIFDVALTEDEIRALYAEFSRSDDVIAHWSMGNSFTDSSGAVCVNDDSGRFPLVFQGGASLTNDGMWKAQSAFFDGTDGTCAKAEVMRNAESLTFAAYIRVPDDVEPYSILSGNRYPRLLDMASGTFAYPSVEIDRMTMLAGYGSNDDNFSYSEVLACKGRWTHVTIVYDAGRDEGGAYYVGSFYRNGKKVFTGEKTYVADFAGGLRPGKHVVRIGGNAGNRPFYGFVDDIWLISRALTEDEVRRFYCGVGPVSAGDDFTVHSDRATLAGNRNPDVAHVDSDGNYGTVRWTQISGPEGAVIADPEHAVTEVELPGEGEYVFRFTKTGEYTSVFDEVTVTRSAGEVPAVPTVTVSAESATVTLPEPVRLSASTSASAPRYVWSKKSGPGGVYFNDEAGGKAEAVFTAPGTYVVSCTVDDGGVTATGDVTVSVAGDGGSRMPGAESGLVAYWNFDNGLFEEFSQEKITPQKPAGLQLSKVGMGIGAPSIDFPTNLLVKGNVDMPFTERATVAFWMYHDHENQSSTVTYSRIWVDKQFAVQYNCKSSYNFTVYVYHGNGTDTFTVNIDANLLRKGTKLNRWSHCALVFDFSPYTGSAEAYTNLVAGAAPTAFSRLKLYIDGDEFIPSKVTTTASVVDGEITITTKTSSAQQSQFCGIASTDRYFPGTLDELRYYTNALTQAQIRRLAWEFSPRNRHPQMETPSAIKCVAHKAVGLGGVVYDDGTDVLDSEWEVVSGDEGEIEFSDPSSPSSTATFSKAGAYVLRLKVSDGDIESVSRNITVTVKPLGTVMVLR